MLQDWGSRNDPNVQRRVVSRGFYPYTGRRQTQGIPLTRAKQKRNLRRLADLLQRLRQLPMKPQDPAAIVQAFTTAHSHAEVYRVEDMEAVFGPIEQIDSATLTISQVDGATVELSSSAQGVATFTPGSGGELSFRCTAQNDSGEQALSDALLVTVTPDPGGQTGGNDNQNDNGSTPPPPPTGRR